MSAGVEKLLEDAQYRRQDRARFGRTEGDSSFADTLTRSNRQGIGIPPALDTEGSDRLVQKLESEKPNVPASATTGKKP